MDYAFPHPHKKVCVKAPIQCLLILHTSINHYAHSQSENVETPPCPHIYSYSRPLCHVLQILSQACALKRLRTATSATCCFTTYNNALVEGRWFSHGISGIFTPH